MIGAPHMGPIWAHFYSTHFYSTHFYMATNNPQSKNYYWTVDIGKADTLKCVEMQLPLF